MEEEEEKQPNKTQGELLQVQQNQYKDEDDKGQEPPTAATIDREEEDPYNISPPDFALAEKHADAMKVKNTISWKRDEEAYSNKDNYCECCGNPTTKSCPVYSLRTGVYELYSLGSGFPLYFQLKRLTMFVFIGMFILVGIPCMSINGNAGRSEEWDVGYDITSVVALSIGNNGKEAHRYNGAAVIAQIVLNFIVILYMLIGVVFFKRYQNKRIAKVQEVNITPSAFAVMVKNLPLDKTKEEVKQWFAEFFKNPEIQYVNFCYDIRKMVKMSRKLDKLKQMKRYLEKFKQSRLKKLQINEDKALAKGIDLHPPPKRYLCFLKKPYPKIDDLNNEIIETKEELKKEEENMKSKSTEDLY